MAELHKRINNLSSPSSSLNHTSNSSNITSIPPDSGSHDNRQKQFNSSTDSPSTYTNHNNDSDSDDDMNPGPPILSSYAMSLLKQLNKDDNSNNRNNDKEINIEITDIITHRFSNRPISSYSYLSNGNTITTRPRRDLQTSPMNRLSSDLSNNDKQERPNRGPSSRLTLSKFNLGAPRRLSESEMNELTDHPHYSHKRKDNSSFDNMNDQREHEKYTYTNTADRQQITANTTATNFFTHSIRGTTLTATTPYKQRNDENQNPLISVDCKKHPISITPRTQRSINSAFSPESKMRKQYDGKGILMKNHATKENHQVTNAITTPRRQYSVASYNDYDTPERGRKASTPLSRLRMDQEVGEFAILKLPQTPIRRTPSNKFPNSLNFKSMLEEQLKLQKERILREVKREKEDELRRQHEHRLAEEEERIYRLKLVGESKNAELHSAHVKKKQLDESNFITVNRQDFECLEQIGKGGSSKVYRARAVNGKKDYAIKVVSFDQFDDSAIVSFKGEIDILKKLRNEKRVVKLIDHSLRNGSLLVVMECGDIDLAHVLASRSSLPFDAGFVRYHAVEMLKCVKAVHDAGIVHSDLKPANFLFVKGMLKLIDFGISSSLSDHTMNIYRECQIGTPNYMAPETLVEVNNTLKGEDLLSNSSTWRIGKPADIWSCGCIIYQMVYGKPPYAGFASNKRILAITNVKVEIQYPRTSTAASVETTSTTTANPKESVSTKVNGLVIETIQKCLRRDPNERLTAVELLETDFLRPKVVTEKFMSDLVKNAIRYGMKHGNIADCKMTVLCGDVWKKVNEYS